MDREFMGSLLVEESFAYGFTIACWGTGLLLIKEYGLLHTRGMLLYALGAITGFGLLAVITFGGAVDSMEVDQGPSYRVLAGIHYLSALVPIVITHFLIVTPLDRGGTLFLAGAVVSIFYNVFVAFEQVVSEALWKLEQATDSHAFIEFLK